MCNPTNCRTPGFPVPHLPELLKLMSIESVTPSNRLILCHPLFFFTLSQHQGFFQWISFSHQVAEVLRVSASESVSPVNNQYWFPLGLTGLISSQSRGLKSILQNHSSKVSILQPSAFFMVQLSHLYVTTGKTIALTIRTFVGKVMSLLFNILSRLVIAFLPRSKSSEMEFLWLDDEGKGSFSRIYN